MRWFLVDDEADDRYMASTKDIAEVIGRNLPMLRRLGELPSLTRISTETDEEMQKSIESILAEFNDWPMSNRAVFLVGFYSLASIVHKLMSEEDPGVVEESDA